VIGRTMTATDPRVKLDHYDERPLFLETFDQITLRITVLLEAGTNRTRIGYKVENSLSYGPMLASESWCVSDILDPDQYAEACHDALKAALAHLQPFAGT